MKHKTTYLKQFITNAPFTTNFKTPQRIILLQYEIHLLHLPINMIAIKDIHKHKVNNNERKKSF